MPRRHFACPRWTVMSALTHDSGRESWRHSEIFSFGQVTVANCDRAERLAPDCCLWCRYACCMTGQHPWGDMKSPPYHFAFSLHMVLGCKLPDRRTAVPSRDRLNEISSSRCMGCGGPACRSGQLPCRYCCRQHLPFSTNSGIRRATGWLVTLRLVG